MGRKLVEETCYHSGLFEASRDFSRVPRLGIESEKFDFSLRV